MNWLSKFFGHMTADVLTDKDGNTVERVTGTYKGHRIQVNRHGGDDSQVTLSVDGKMVPRLMNMDDVDDSIEVNT